MSWGENFIICYVVSGLAGAFEIPDTFVILARSNVYANSPEINIDK